MCCHISMASLFAIFAAVQLHGIEATNVKILPLPPGEFYVGSMRVRNAQANLDIRLRWWHSKILLRERQQFLEVRKCDRHYGTVIRLKSCYESKCSFRFVNYIRLAQTQAPSMRSKNITIMARIFCTKLSPPTPLPTPPRRRVAPKIFQQRLRYRQCTRYQQRLVITGPVNVEEEVSRPSVIYGPEYTAMLLGATAFWSRAKQAFFGGSRNTYRLHARGPGDK